MKALLLTVAAYGLMAAALGGIVAVMFGLLPSKAPRRRHGTPGVARTGEADSGGQGHGRLIGFPCALTSG